MLLRPTPAIRPSSRAATIAASWSSKRAPTRPSPGSRKVDRGEPADPQAAQVVLDTLTQLVRIIERQDGTGLVAPDRDLTDDRQPVGVGVERAGGSGR